MKAAVYRGPWRIKVEDVLQPNISEGEDMVEFEAGSICGSDLHFYRGEWTMLSPGQIIGHDACGRKAETGERVAMIPGIYCGDCWYCLRGMQNLCLNRKIKGFDLDGLFAEYVVIPPRNLIPIPENVSDEEAAMLEPVTLALHTLNLLAPKIGDWATIIGQGPIGLLMTKAAKLKGCKVIAIDLHDYRLKLSESYGADFCINAKQEETVLRVQEITSRGSDIVIEAAGTRQTVEQTPLLVRNAGKVALTGEFEGFLDLRNAVEAAFISVFNSRINYPLALSLISEKTIDVKCLVSHRFKLTDFERAIQTANNIDEKPVKVIITK